MKSSLAMMLRLPLAFGGFALSAYEAVLQQNMLRLVLVLVALLVAWHLYVPIHELLHVAGCVLTGGSVQALHLDPQYGADLLQPLFPFIVSGSDYAGRLSDFQVPNYWAYAVVDLFPYIISVPGLALLEAARRRRNSLLFGVAVLLAFIPLMGVTGDFFEAASLPLSALGEALWGWPEGALICDDIFRCWPQWRQAGLLDAAGMIAVALAFVGAVLLIWLWLGLQWWFARLVYEQDVLGLMAENSQSDPD